jgi:phosphosulfolactate phosphohydrolase-like enzyme
LQFLEPTNTPAKPAPATKDRPQESKRMKTREGKRIIFTDYGKSPLKGNAHGPE